MRNSFSDPGFLVGVNDKPAPEDTENRSWGTFAKDVAIDVSRPVVGLARTVAQGARALDVPGGEATEEFLGGVERDMTGARSARAQALDTLSVAPTGDERSFWREPIAGSVHMMLPSVPYLAAAALTGGTSIPAQAGLAGVAAIEGAGANVNELADFARQTPRDQLMQLEPFQKFMREYNGDEKAAREALFRQSVDWKAALASGAANAAEIGSVLSMLGIKEAAGNVIKQRFVNAVRGGAAGAVSGAAEGATDAYMQEVGKVRTGQQEAVNAAPIAAGITSGAAFGVPVGVGHAFQRIRPPTTAIDTDTRGVLDQQINPPPPPTPAAGGAAAIDTSWPGQPEQPAAPGNVEPGPAPQFPPAPEFPPPKTNPDAQPIEVDQSSLAEVAPPPAQADATGSVGSPPQTPPGVPDGTLDDSFTSTFKTALGSEYYVYPDGTTVRNRAPREGDDQMGLQNRSGLTIFLTPGHADVLRAKMAAPTRFAKQLGFTRAGRLGLQFTEGPSAGKFMDGTLGRISDQPVVGMNPLELWDGGRYHFGHTVTEVSERSAPAPAGEAGTPPASAPAPQVEAEAGPVTTEVTPMRVQPVPVPDMARTPVTPPRIDAVTLDALRAIMLGVEPKNRQLGAAMLQDRLGRMGRLTGADIPPEMTARMTPDDVATLRTAVETDPVTAIEMIRETPSGDMDAAYRGFAERYPERVGQAPAQAERPNRPQPPPLKTREQFYAQRAPGEMNVPGTGGEAGFAAQEAEEQRRLAGERPQIVGEALREKTRNRRERRIAERNRRLRAKGERIASKRPQLPAPARIEPEAGEGVRRQAQRIIEQAEAERTKETLYEAGPTDEERQLRADIEQFNTDVKNKALNVGRHRREALIRRAKQVDRARAERGADQPFTKEIAELPKERSPAQQFNDVLAKIADWATRPAAEVIKSREVAEAFQKLMVINADRPRSKKFPVPSWLYDAWVQREESAGWAANRAAQEQRERQAEYEAARQRLLAEKRATVKPTMREVSADQYQNATDNFIREYRAKPAMERERLRTEAEQIASLPPRSTITSKVIEEVERRFQEAAKRVAAGEPYRLPGVSLPSQVEALQEMRRRLRQLETDKTRRATRERQYDERETEIDLSLRKAIKARFGSPNRFRDFLISLWGKLTAAYPEQVNEARLGERGLDEPLPLAARRGLPQDVRTYRDRMEHQRRQFLQAKKEQLALGLRLEKFLGFAIDKINKDLKTYQSQQYPSGGSIGVGWQLPKSSYNKNTNRFSFNIGASEDNFAMYGIANDLQKVHEALRFQREQIAAELKGKGFDINNLDQDALIALAGDLRRYTAPMQKVFENFALDMGYYIEAKPDKNNKFDYSPITSARKARSSETTQRYLEGPIDIRSEERTQPEDQIAQAEDVTVRGEDQMIADIDRSLAREQRSNQRAGRNIMSAEDRYARLKETDPELHAKLERSKKLRADNFDADGYPANAWNQEFQTEFTPEEQAKLDAWQQLEQEGEPTSEHIQRTSVPAVLNEVKEIVTSGVMTDLPTEYVNSEFIDRLGRIAGDTAVYTAPVDVTGAAMMDSPAHYNAKLDRVVLPNDMAPAAFARATIHEVAHAATHSLLTQDARFAGQVRDLLARAVAAAKRRGMDEFQLPKHLYGLMSPDEFIAEAMANRKFRGFLESVPTPTHPVIQGVRNALNGLYRAIRDAWRKVVGAKDGDTALDVLFYDQSTVLGRTDEIIQRMVSRQERTGRPAFKESAEDPKLYNDGKYYLRLAGVKAFMDELPTKAVQNLRETQANLSQNQGRGLSWHTLADMTHRGTQEFRAITNKLFSVIEQNFATRANIIRYEDTPKLAKIAQFFNKLDEGTRQRVQEFLVDESYHGYYADAYLSDVKNKHFADNISTYQSKSEHPKMMREYQALKAIDGFDEIRNLLHQIGEEREKVIRSSRIRDLIHHSGLLPDSLRDAHERERLVDALEALTDPYGKKPTEAQKALIRQHVGALDSPQVLQTITDINNTDDISRILGPYIPFIRKGDYAVSGNFKLPVPTGASMLDPPINRETNKPQGEPRIIFDTAAAAEQYVRQITRDFGITQTGGGFIDIDTATGQRPKIEKDGRMVTARGKDLEDAIAKGMHVQKKYYVQFQTQLLEFYPSKYEADRAVKQWRDRYGGRLQIANTQDVYKHDARQNEQYVSAQLQKMIRRVRAQPTYQALSDSEKSAISDSMNLAAATYINRRGVQQRFLPRGYVKGASTDVPNIFKDYLSMTAGYMAKLKHNADISKYSKEMKDYLDSHVYEAGNNNALLHQRIYDAYMRRLHSPTVNNRDTTLNRWVDRALRYTMLDKLPSAAYFTVNATEPSVIALPLLAGKHAYGKAVTTMGQFYRMGSKSVRSDDPMGGSFKLPTFLGAGISDVKAAIKNDNVTPRTDYLDVMSKRVADQPDAANLQDLFKQASGRGVFDAASSLEYDRAFVNSPSVIDRVADRLQNIFMAANSAVENMNRFVTVGTAYRLERSRLAKVQAGNEIKLTDQELHQQAVDYAISIAHQAAGQYANYNAPERFNTGPFARLMFQFKKYPQRIIANYIRATVNAFGKDPTLRKQGLRQLGFMLATQMMVAGAMGLPLEPFTIPLNTLHIMGVVPYNADDVQAGWRQWAARNFSPEIGELLMHGPLRLTGVDVGSRLGQSTLATFGSPASTKTKDLQASLFTMMAGATGSTGFEALTGMQLTNEGLKAWANGADDLAFKKFAQAAQHLILFRAASDVLTAIQQGDTEGNRTSTGRQMRAPLSLPEQVVRATGFTPASAAEASEARRAVKQATDRLKAQRKQLIDQWVQSPPGAQRQEIFTGAIREFNAGKPADQRITVADLMRAQGTYQKARRQGPEQLGLAVDKQMKTLLPDAGAYMTR